MVAPTVYSSTDASAPVLNGVAGSLIAVLDACLVTGYGAKSAAGWTKEFSGTNKAAYKMGLGGTARRMFLRVDNAIGNYARIVGYDTMSDVDTGLEPFPTNAQFSGGLYIPTSIDTSATARGWMVIATATAFYLFISSNQPDIYSGATSDVFRQQIFFGEYITYVPAFTYNVALIGATSPSPSSGSVLGTQPNQTYGALPLCAGHYACRAHSGDAGSATMAKHWFQISFYDFNTNRQPGTYGGISTPDPVTGKVLATRVRLTTNSISDAALVGHLPGFRIPCTQQYMGAHGDTAPGAGALAGNTFMRVWCSHHYGSNNSTGQALVNITDFD